MKRRQWTFLPRVGTKVRFHPVYRGPHDGNIYIVERAYHLPGHQYPVYELQGLKGGAVSLASLSPTGKVAEDGTSPSPHPGN